MEKRGGQTSAARRGLKAACGAERGWDIGELTRGSVMAVHGQPRIEHGVGSARVADV